MKMKAKKKSLQYTVRGVPRSVDRALREKSRRERKSFNRVMVEALAKEAGISVGEPTLYTDLDPLVGKWLKDPATEAALEEMRRVDEADWKE